MYANALARFYGQPLAIELNTAHLIESILLSRENGVVLSKAERDAWKAESSYGSSGINPRPGQAVIGVYGPILNRVGPMQSMSGMTGSRDIASAIRSAADDPSIERIFLDVDSPGGEVVAMDDPSDALEYAMTLKPVTAVTQGMMCSGGYWLGVASNEIVASPNAMVGSIGVIRAHVDKSEQNKALGRNVTYLSTAEKKAYGNSDQPLSEAAEAELMREAYDYHAAFVSHIAKHRNKTAAFVDAEWADGRVERGETAVKLGMVDRLGTLEEVMREYAPKTSKVATRSRVAKRR